MLKLKAFLKNQVSYSNALLAIFLLVLVYFKYPEIKKNSDNQGIQVETKFNITDLNSQKEIIFPSNKKMLVAFWATWCAPCKVELKRINNLIASKKISPDQVLAISLDEKKEELLTFMADSKYGFQIAHDLDGKMSEFFKITGTPTLLLIDESNFVNWRTTGLSPSLEVRVLSFFR